MLKTILTYELGMPSEELCGCGHVAEQKTVVAACEVCKKPVVACQSCDNTKENPEACKTCRLASNFNGCRIMNPLIEVEVEETVAVEIAAFSPAPVYVPATPIGVPGTNA